MIVAPITTGGASLGIAAIQRATILSRPLREAERHQNRPRKPRRATFTHAEQSASSRTQSRRLPITPASARYNPPMRTPSKRRQLTRWLTTTISVAFLATWIFASFKTYTYVSSGRPKRDFHLAAGCVHWFEPVSQGTNVDRHDTYYLVSRRWLRTFEPGLTIPMTYVAPGLGRFTIIPLWLPFLLAAIPTALLWRRDRRPGPDDCQNCGYNMTGNQSNKCPECGTPMNSTSVPVRPRPLNCSFELVRFSFFIHRRRHQRPTPSTIQPTPSPATIYKDIADMINEVLLITNYQ